MRYTVSLRSNRDFKRMYARATSAPGACLVLFLRRNRLGKTRLGVTVGTKLGIAVRRNRIRRRLKEAYRLVEDRLLPGYDIVMVARSGAEHAPFELLKTEVVRLFNRLLSQQGGSKPPRGAVKK